MTGGSFEAKQDNQMAPYRWLRLRQAACDLKQSRKVVEADRNVQMVRAESHLGSEAADLLWASVAWSATSRPTARSCPACASRAN
jgi:hypothetical protein